MKRRDLLKTALALIPGLAFLRPAKATAELVWIDEDLSHRTHDVVIEKIRHYACLAENGKWMAMGVVTMLFDSDSKPGEFTNALEVRFMVDWERRFDLLAAGGGVHRVTSEWRYIGEGNYNWRIVEIDGVKI